MSLKIIIGIRSEWIDSIVKLYEEAGLGRKDPERLKEAFLKSYRVVSCWDDDILCGIGRMVSDGVYYACIFDVAVKPSYQRRGIGRSIMQALEDAVCGLRIHLTSTFNNEEFYRKLGYRFHRTAMAKYPADSPYLSSEKVPPR